MRILEDGKKGRLHGLLYADSLVLCGELEEYLRALVRRVVEKRRRRGLKVNSGKRKVVVLNGENGWFV